MIAVLLCALLVSLDIVAHTELLLVVYGVWSSWLYLRYVQAIGGRRGDARAEFGFHVFFPAMFRFGAAPCGWLRCGLIRPQAVCAAHWCRSVEAGCRGANLPSGRRRRVCGANQGCRHSPGRPSA